MKQYDWLQAWKDLSGLFGVEAASALVLDGVEAGQSGRIWVRLPSRFGWTWRAVGPQSNPTDLRVEVTLQDDPD